jgi:hydrogenase maturation protease
VTNGPEQRVVVAAVGNELRRDDGVGAAVLTHLGARLEGAAVLPPLPSPLGLLGAWDGASLAVVIDAAWGSDVDPGAVTVTELGSDAGRGRRASVTTHGYGVADALRLARALGTAPDRVVVVAVAGEDFGLGSGLSPSVAHAVGKAARVVEGLAGTGGGARTPSGM